MKPTLKELDTLPTPLRVFLQVIGVTSFLCLGVEAICRMIHLGYPYNWPLLFPDINFWDFRAYFDQFRSLHTAAFFTGPDVMMYPAPLVVCYAGFYAFGPGTIATSVFLSFIAIVFLTAAILATRALIRRGLAPRPAMLFMATTFLLSFPLWFEFKQGNMEVIVWLVLSLGLWAVMTERYWLAALLFGLAGGLKFYPIVYLGLLLSKRLYQQCIAGCVVAVLSIVLSLWFVGPTLPVAWHGMQWGLQMFHDGYMLVVRPNEIGFDHSIFGVIKTVLGALKKNGIVPPTDPHERGIMLNCYLVAVAIIGTVLYFVRIRFMPVMNQILCLVVATILLPPVSFEYTDLHLYAPWLVLCLIAIKAKHVGESIKGLTAVFFTLALAVSPLSEFIFHHERFGGQIRCLILVALFFQALRYPYSSESLQEAL